MILDSEGKLSSSHSSQNVSHVDVYVGEQENRK